MLLKRLQSALPKHLAEHLPTLSKRPFCLRADQPRLILSSTLLSPNRTHFGALIIDRFNVKTTENLLYTPRQHLDNIPIPSRDLDELIAYVLQATGPKYVKGDQALKEEEAKGEEVAWYGWGRSQLDEIIDWDGVGVMEISGSKRVGKSLLALHAALRVLTNESDSICRWIDTEGSFSPSRARKILEEMDPAVQDIEQVLSRLEVSPCFQVEPDMFSLISEMKSRLESSYTEVEDVPTEAARIKVIVIDPISTLFRDTLTATTSQGHAAMVTTMEELAELTYTHNLLTIITNTTASSLPVNPLSSFSATAIKPALGTAFTYHSDVSLLVQETGKVFGLIDEQERERTRSQPGLRGLIEVVKSRVSPAGRWSVFETTGTTLLDVIPPETEDERTLAMSAGMSGPPRPLFGPLTETMLR